MCVCLGVCGSVCGDFLQFLGLATTGQLWSGHYRHQVVQWGHVSDYMVSFFRTIHYDHNYVSGI